MATKGLHGFHYLTLNDAPDLAGATEALATDGDAWATRAYPVANAAARVALGAVGEGFLVRQRDDGSVWIYTDLGTWAQIGAVRAAGEAAAPAGRSSRPTPPRAAQTLANATDTPIAFGVGSDSSSVVRSTKGVGHKFTCVAGTYLVAACVRFASGDAGSRFLGLRKSDDSVQYISAQNDGGPNAATRTFAQVVVLGASADLYVAGSQSSGGSLATQPTGTPSPSGYVSLTITRLG
jgi:hypothetical protein